MSLFAGIKKFFKGLDQQHRHKAIEDLEWEMHELQHIFGLLTLGYMVGLPSAPLPVAWELLPDMPREFAIMLARLDTAQNPLSEQFSRLDVS